jgi:hypothetical protein
MVKIGEVLSSREGCTYATSAGRGARMLQVQVQLPLVFALLVRNVLNPDRELSLATQLPCY